MPNESQNLVCSELKVSPIGDTEISELPTGVRVLCRTHPGIELARWIEHGDVVSSLVDVAIALDIAADTAAENIGSYGNIDAGSTLVEVTFDDDHPSDRDTNGDRVYGIRDPILSGLPQIVDTADRRRLLAHIGSQRRKTVWDGNNHIEGCSYNGADLFGLTGGRTTY